MPTASSMVTASDWTKGIVLSVAASMIGGASKLAIRRSWLLLEEQPNNDDGNVVARSTRLRRAGVVGMTVLNPACCVWAMAYASPSVLAPFSGLTLVWIVAFSESCVGERPTPSQIGAAALIVTGEVVAAYWGDHSNEFASVDAVLASYADPNFVLYLVALSLWMIGLYATIAHGASERRRRFAWGASGGCVTGLQNFLKDGLTVARDVDDPRRVVAAAVFFAGAGATALVGFLCLVACLRRYDAAYSSSMFVGSFVVSASLMSAAHYRTLSRLTSTTDRIMYPLGLALILSGVAVLIVVPVAAMSTPHATTTDEEEATTTTATDKEKVAKRRDHDRGSVNQKLLSNDHGRRRDGDGFTFT